MIARLDREERMRRELFAAVSHDLRTPITSLDLLATAIEKEAATASASRRLQIVESSASTVTGSSHRAPTGENGGHDVEFARRLAAVC